MHRNAMRSSIVAVNKSTSGTGCLCWIQEIQQHLKASSWIGFYSPQVAYVGAEAVNLVAGSSSTQLNRNRK